MLRFLIFLLACKFVCADQVSNMTLACPASSQRWWTLLACPRKTLPRDKASKEFNVDYKSKCFLSCSGDDCVSASYDSGTKTCYHFNLYGECEVMVEENQTVYYHKTLKCLYGGEKISSSKCQCHFLLTGPNCGQLKVTFQGVAGAVLEFTTETQIVPDVFPFPDCQGTGCTGVLV